MRFFPVGAPGVFREAMAPGETVDWVNTPGRPVYVLPIFDVLRRMWWKMETYAYPLYICTAPIVAQLRTIAAEARSNLELELDQIRQLWTEWLPQIETYAVVEDEIEPCSLGPSTTTLQ